MHVSYAMDLCEKVHIKCSMLFLNHETDLVCMISWLRNPYKMLHAMCLTEFLN